MSITTISEIITFICAVAGALGGAYAVIKRLVLGRLDNICDRMKALERWTSRQQTDLSERVDENTLMMTAVMLILKKMEQYPLNGEVRDTIDNLNSYIFEHSRKMTSYFEN